MLTGNRTAAFSYSAGPVEEYFERPQSIPRKPVPDRQRLGDTVPKHEYQSVNASERAHQHRDSPQSRSFLTDWWLELASCVLVLAALLAIVGITFPYRDRPLPNWPYSLSINTLVAIFIAVAKSAMLLVMAEGISHLKWTWFTRQDHQLIDLSTYDNASRGPWGSLKLLGSSRGRDIIASIGAFIVVASIGMDPFAQQIVHYYPCIIQDLTVSTDASIPRTGVYDFTSGIRISAAEDIITGDFQRSINAGIFSPGEAQVNFNCPTGNCTFPDEYHTVGYCGNCSDATSDLHIKSVKKSENFIVRNYSLPSGFEVVTPTGQFDEELTYFAIANFTENTVEILLTPPYISSSTPHDKSTSRYFGENTIGAARCSLYPCIKTYEATVKDGKLVEHLKTIWSDLDFPNRAALDLKCLPQKDLETVRAANYSYTPDQKWLLFDYGYDPRREHTEYPWYPLPRLTTSENVTLSTTECSYEAYYWSIISISGFLESFFYGYLTGDDATGLNPVSGPNVPLAIYNQMGEPNYNDYSLAQLDSVFKSIANSMTVNMRQNGQSGTNRPVLGYAARNETCVRVRWAWLTYPAALAVLSFCFLFAMLWRTRRGDDEAERLRDWKSNTLPLLYHGFGGGGDDKVRDGNTGLYRIDDMKEAARRTRVQLLHDAGGGQVWRFAVT